MIKYKKGMFKMKYGLLVIIGYRLNLPRLLQLPRILQFVHLNQLLIRLRVLLDHHQ